ncbi:MAG: biopolymer transporter ExbD [Steroidobacteraceae bacterium]|nr:biopolymer transporter ExbD [Steroidobacteraceae bacterium]
MSATTQIAEPQLNATPLIDVLLVLIVMLIFTIPIATHAVKLTLPQGKPALGPVPIAVVVGIAFDGMLTLNDEPVASIASLEQRLRELQRLAPAPHVLLRADPRAAYEPVAQVLAATQRARVSNLRIIDLGKL